jgi:pimeloyl-[acyl-carrier protein] methyl ester esterase
MSLHLEYHGITSAGANAKSLVCFHGWGFNARIWYPLLKDLQSNYQVYLVDLPGFGHSAEMAWEAFKTKLLTKLPPRFVLLAWSMGGLYASRLALEMPERIEHVINVCSSPYFIHCDQEGSLWPGVKIPALEQFYQALLANPQQTLQDFIKLHAGAFKLDDLLSPLPRPSALLAGFEVLKQWDFRAQLIHLNMPLSYLFGRLDSIIPRDLLPVMRRHYPQFQYHCFKKAGHVPFLSQPDEFLHVLDGLL